MYVVAESRVQVMKELLKVDAVMGSDGRKWRSLNDQE